MREAWIIDAVRTPRGKGKRGTPEKPGGSLSETHPTDLLATCLRALGERNPIDVRDVDDVVAGCVSQAGEQGANIARNAVLLAGWPLEVGGVALNRFCGSGLQGMNFAVMGVLSGIQEMAVGGGVESMSHQPIGSDGGGLDGGNLNLRALHPLVPQGISADLIATLEGFSREDVDGFAVTSQRKAGAALAEGRFGKSVVPVLDRDGNTVLDHDEFARPDTTLQSLAKLQPSFVGMGAYDPYGAGETFDQMALRIYPQAKKITHVHHAGNSSGIVDGASAVLIASSDYARAHGLKPRGRVRTLATVGSEPVIMLTAPGPASRKALQKAGMDVEDIDLWEINEAFACVPLKTMRDLEIDPEKVNVNGGAIALGHPIGATGAMLVGTALDELERRDLSTALITLCIGGGMGIATIIERI
jgi:acetyl-CoA C-acetyltransferase